MIHVFPNKPDFSGLFTAYLPARVDHLFNADEKRLTRSSCCSPVMEKKPNPRDPSEDPPGHAG